MSQDRQRPTNEDDIARALAAPFPPSAVEWRVGNVAKEKPKAMAMAYIDARAVRKRLDAVMGIGGWRCHHYALGEHQIACEIQLKLNGEWVGKTDGGRIGNIETTGGKVDPKEEQRLDMEGKGAFSVALKRAAVTWGIGGYLYDMPAPWEEIDQYKRFTKDAEKRLLAVAAKPYDDWKREQAAKKPAGPQARPAGQAAPTQQPPQSPPADDPKTLLVVWTKRFQEAADLDVFTRQTEALKTSWPFVKDSPEDKAIRATWQEHAARVGYKMPPKAQGATKPASASAS